MTQPAQRALCTTFLAALPEVLASEIAPDHALASTLSSHLCEARERYPTIALPAETYLPYVAARCKEPQQLHTLQWQDLYLACGCAQGISEAVAQFAQMCASFFPELKMKFKLTETLFEELKQGIWVELFTAQGERAPKITQYAGHGKLVYWSRIIFLREILRARQRESTERPVERKVLALLTPPSGDGEQTYLKTLYREQFQAAIRSVLRRLPTRDRNILRYYYIDGLNSDKIGAIYGVHRSTVARWLHRTRTVLFQALRTQLVDQLEIELDEFESIMKLLHSQLDMTLPNISKKRRPRPKAANDASPGAPPEPPPPTAG